LIEIIAHIRTQWDKVSVADFISNIISEFFKRPF